MSRRTDIANLGIVIEVDDPEGLKIREDKVKVRIPAIHGPLKKEDLPPEWQNTTTWVEDDKLPWIPLCYPLGTSSPNKKLLKKKEIVYILYTAEGGQSPVIIGTAGVTVKEGT